jgi:Fe-S-cluster containining protein
VLETYRQLTAKIDAFFARVAARHGGEMQCAAGCSACCHQRLTVTAVEAAAIEAWAASLSAAERAALGSTADPDRCAALDDHGRCRIYPARPLVCRSHGIPIRMKSERSLPVIQSCELNFRAHGPAAADPDCVLDQELVSTMLGLIDREHMAHGPSTRRQEAARSGQRVELADVLTGLRDP